MPLTLLAVQSDAPLWERFRENPNTAFTVNEMLVGLSTIAAAGLAWWLWVRWQRFREHRQYTSSAGLFVELCRAHHITRHQRALLWAIARAQQLAQPAQMFLRPELYWPPHVPPKLSSRQKMLVQLHKQIFGGEKASKEIV